MDGLGKVAERGFSIVNIDCVVRLEKPKLSPYKELMRERIASVLKISPDQIGIKGKTGEAIGDIGQSRLCEAHCVVLLEQIPPSGSL